MVQLSKASLIDLFLMSTSLSRTQLHVGVLPIGYQQVNCRAVNLRCYIFNLTLIDFSAVLFKANSKKKGGGGNLCVSINPFNAVYSYLLKEACKVFP